ncbi:hypothetical protein J2Z35_001218 [Acetoanaerobium pronyense]|uniref:Uncharacterized protein n=1 Tax=Acetoanaerobium pronyense TaxID=1482736 RepID=A0ABS4KLE2_9FIRM|nr:hypothetical protein [Acetoanaerobium pronyense]MBP2027424.1 hypothetical protein [Acetoanaerobium pronyense]
MNTKKEIGDSLNKQMPYCTNHKCINYYEDSCMYLFEDGPLKINPMEYSDETCEAFISGKHPLYLEEILEITERYQALVEAVRETMNMNKAEDDTFGAYERGWQGAANRINQAIDCYIPKDTDESKELIDRITAATKFLNDINEAEQPWLEISEIEWQTGNRYKDDCLGNIWCVNEDENTLINYGVEYPETIETIFNVRDIYVMRFKKISESEEENE